MSTDERRLREHFDWPVVWTVLGLFAIGLINLYSAVSGGATSRLFWMQLTFGLVGLVAMFAVTLIDYRMLERLAYPIWGVGVGLLVFVALLGHVSHGARGWIPLGPVHFEPVEFTKLAIVVGLAKWFHDHPSPNGYTLWELRTALLLVGVPAGLLLIQPDLGGTGLVLMISTAVILFVRIETWTLAIATIAGLVAAPLAYFFVLSPYQQDRILVFLNPEMQPRGRGYNVIQSKIAIGAGEMFGRGYNHGTQSKLRFLPEHHTDFIFSVLAEEWGFLGCVVVLSLFFVLLFLGLRTARRSKDRFGALLAFGMVAIFFVQILVNIGGATGLMPVTGVTLPFLSYGGSALLMNFVAIGLLLNVGMRRFMF